MKRSGNSLFLELYCMRDHFDHDLELNRFPYFERGFSLLKRDPFDSQKSKNQLMCIVREREESVYIASSHMHNISPGLCSLRHEINLEGGGGGVSHLPK